tara:strand:+ start:217 stop:399 length:183 start_codon:yes stop_codon:yes gene_type:complete
MTAFGRHRTHPAKSSHGEATGEDEEIAEASCTVIFALVDDGRLDRLLVGGWLLSSSSSSS